MFHLENHDEKFAVPDADIMAKIDSPKDATIAPMTEKKGKSILWKIDLK